MNFQTSGINKVLYRIFQECSVQMGFKNKFFLALLLFFPFCLCAEELEALDHFVCLRKKATVVETRSLRIHQFPVEKKMRGRLFGQREGQGFISGQMACFLSKKSS